MSHSLSLTVALTAMLSSSAYAFNDSSLEHNALADDRFQFSYQPETLKNSTSSVLPESRFHFSSQFSVSASLANDKPRKKYFVIQDEKDWDYLTGQTYTILGLSVATVGLMTLLPESVTKWDEEDRDLSRLGPKWKDNVTDGPVWDKDEHFLNYVMHPYFGGVYYTAARHAGFNEFESFVYSGVMSTFFWEYGVESFAEIPSWQDIIVTPVFGALVGEVMLDQEQEILNRGGTVLGSETLGSVSLFFLNPVGHIHGWISGLWGGSADVSFRYQPFDPNPFSQSSYSNSYHTSFNLPSDSFQSGFQSAQDTEFYGVELKITF